MSCREIQVKMSAYIDGELSEFESEQVRRHVAVCPSCARELLDLERAADILSSLEDVDPPGTLESGLRRRIRRRAAGLIMVVLLLALAGTPLWSMGSVVLQPGLPLWAKIGYAFSIICLSVSLGFLIFHLLRNVRSLVLYGYLSGGQ